MTEVRTRPWTRKEIKLLVDRIPGPITPEKYPPNPKTEADRAIVGAARLDGRYLDLNETERRILDGRFPVDDSFPKTFRALGEEFGSSSSSARNAYEHVLKKLRKDKG